MNDERHESTGPARESAAPPPAPAERTIESELAGAVPGLARVAAGAWFQTARWTLESTIKAGRRLSEAAASPNEAAALLREIEALVRRMAGAEAPKQLEAGEPHTLRERGAELLRRSNDVHHEEESHPAYEWILGEIAPDEARILRLLHNDGPQPSVDVRTGGPLGLINSELIAGGLTMIGARSGCRYPDRVHAYLNNLFRLGLLWFSRETLDDVTRYQVIEAQPEVLEAMHSVRFPKLVRRSIHLTPFGEDFCREALGLGEPVEPAKAPAG